MKLPTTLFISIFFVIVPVWGYSVAHPVKESFTVSLAHAQTIVEETPAPTASPIPTDIVGYINYKFGADAPKAFQVLQGEGCSENKKLNPEAKNDNRTWGGVGVDRGYWQINDVYHPTVSDACAKDVKCSTDYAYRMYKNDNYSFKRWTCGRHHGV